jgi:hypothetical protein
MIDADVIRKIAVHGTYSALKACPAHLQFRLHGSSDVGVEFSKRDANDRRIHRPITPMPSATVSLPIDHVNALPVGGRGTFITVTAWDNSSVVSARN